MRVSTARRVIVRKLFEADGPISAQQIAGQPEDDASALDVASVYRNLETLEQVGVVRHFHAGHGPGRYVLVGAGEREYLACDRCGEVVEVDPNQLDAIRGEIRDRFDFAVHFTHFPMIGLCGECAGSEQP